MLSRDEFHNRFLQYFGFPPTESQREAMDHLADFIYEKGERYLFILKGYAGTGKTTLVSALIKALQDVNVRTIVLAPTGRAAKVISQYAGKKAYTIHKWIYRMATRQGLRQFVRRENKFTHTLFIVDEASMISASSSAGEIPGMNSLLDDLMDYVYAGEHNRMLFIGDDAQLPPVQESQSPALNRNYLNNAFSLTIKESSLTDVVRQAYDSGILFNATMLRDKLSQGDLYPPFFSKQPFVDFTRVNGGDLEELLNTLYNDFDCDEIVTVTRSNKRACLFNNEIRNRILYREGMIAAGDYLMIVKNSYYWVDEGSDVGFLANGDIMEILSIQRQQELYGFHFADVTVRLCDYPEYPAISIKIILESIDYEGPSLSYEDYNKLYRAVEEDYLDILNRRERFLKIKNDPYLNAVQVKFAYAFTCHKTQGGQWKNVLVDQGYLTDEQIDESFLRWLYTAVTRCTKHLYLINFKEEMFE